MAHYAFLDKNNIVTEVIAGRDENDIVDGISNWEIYYGYFRGQKCVRTSYNGNIRKNYAGIGYTYNEDLDAFIPPKPYQSWILNEETCLWEAPIECPSDGEQYNWNEETLSWEQV